MLTSQRASPEVHKQSDGSERRPPTSEFTHFWGAEAASRWTVWYPRFPARTKQSECGRDTCVWLPFDPPPHPLTSGHALWDRPRYVLKVMLEGLMRLFIFSAVWVPNTCGTMGSASPWHCSTWTSILAQLVQAWEQKGLGLPHDYHPIIRGWIAAARYS